MARMESISFAALVIGLAVGSLACPKSGQGDATRPAGLALPSAEAEPRVSPPSVSAPIPTMDAEGPKLQVIAADRQCNADADCTLAMVRCSCDCGVAINKEHQKKYLDLQAQMCRDFKGKMCKMSCLQALGCVEKVCTIKGT